MKNSKLSRCEKEKRLNVKCKRSLSVLFITTIVLMLTGCTKSMIISELPPNLRQECPELREIESGQGKDLMLWIIEFVGKYNDCREKHKAIVGAWPDS